MKLRQIIKGNNSRNLTRNFVALGILQVMRYLIPLIVLPYVTHIIGLEHFGEIAVAGSIMMIVQIVVNYSFGFMGARDIARYRDDNQKVSEIISSTLFAYILLYTIMLLLMTIVVISVPKFREIWPVIAIYMGTPICSALVCEWFFLGIEEMQNITIVNVLSKAISLLLVFTLIKEKDDYLLYPLFSTIGFLFAALYSIFIIIKKYNCKIKKTSFDIVIMRIKEGKNLFLNQVCVNLFQKIPNILLGTMSGTSSAGIYYAASHLHDAGFHAVSTLNRVFFPFLARRLDKHDIYRKINLMFALVLSITLFVFAPWLIRLFYAPEFSPATLLLRIFSISILFLAISSAYSVNYLLLIGKERLVRNITFCVAGFGFLLLLILIKYFNETGAALTMVIVNMLYALSYFIAAKKLKSQNNIK